MLSRRSFLYVVVLIIAVACVGVFLMMPHSSQSNPQYIDAPAEMQELSLEFASDVQSQTAHIASDLKNLSQNLSGLTPDDPYTSELIRNYYDLYPDAAGVAWVDVNGSVCRVPMFSISAILESPEIAAINESSFAEQECLLIGPLLSRTYGMVLCFVVPVYTEDGTYNGFVCMPHPTVLLLNATPGTPYFKDTIYGLWVINADGTYLYHPDAGLIGQNIYTDPLFMTEPSVLTGVRAVVASPAGAMKYTGYELSFTTVVEKTGVWTTVPFGGQELRLVLDNYSYVPPKETLPEKTVTSDRLRSIAESMLVYASAHGKEKTLAAINNPSGPFAVSGYAVFAFGMNGTMLAAPSEPYGVGMDRTNYRDAYGIRSVNLMINRCLQGGGYINYYQTDPYLDQQALLKLAYVLPVNEDWFIGVGGQVLDHPVSYDIQYRMKLVRTVQAAEAYVTAFGKEAALSKMMDPTDPLVIPKDTHLFALDYNGTLLADETDLAAVGNDVFFYTNSYGDSPIRETSLIARAGGGYFYIESDDPVTGQYVLSLCYVEPVDETWCIACVMLLNSYDAPKDSLEAGHGGE